MLDRIRTEIEPTFGVMYKYLIVVVFATLLGVDAICKFPKIYLKRGLYRKILGPNTGAVVKFSCKDPTTLTELTSGTKAQCIDDSNSGNGVFRLTRIGRNMYRCTKSIPLRHPFTAGLLFVYAGEFREYKYTPTLCEVCRSVKKWTQNLFVADNLNNNDVKGSAEKFPPIGSTLPKGCSRYSYESDGDFNDLWLHAL